MIPEWLRKHYEELYHHGIKGQKWGIRRTPEQLRHEKKQKGVDNLSEKRTIVVEAIRSGQVSKKINRAKQLRHTLSGHLPGRSYIDGDLEYAQALVDKLSGTGSPVIGKDGEWNHRERVTSPHIIGTHVTPEGTTSKTNRAMIVYSKTGTHIYPRKESEE